MGRLIVPRLEAAAVGDVRADDVGRHDGGEAMSDGDGKGIVCERQFEQGSFVGEVDPGCTRDGGAALEVEQAELLAESDMISFGVRWNGVWSMCGKCDGCLLRA